MRDNEYLVKLTALSHIDELAEASVVQRNKEGKPKTTPDAKNHPFAKDGFEYRTVFFMDYDGKYYKITMSVGLSDGVSTVYTVVPQKETAVPGGDVISVVGSKALGSAVSTTTVAQNASGVNTQSMQEGDEVSTGDGESGVQGALLTPEMLGDTRAALRRAMESALELPTLTDGDIEWVVKQGEKIESLKDKPVEQASVPKCKKAVFIVQSPLGCLSLTISTPF